MHEQLSDGAYRLVGNKEQVHLLEHIHFLAEPEKHEYTVTVNEQPVKLHENLATGAEIKAAAIRQGVLIQENFILQEELPNGTSRPTKYDLARRRYAQIDETNVITGFTYERARRPLLVGYYHVAACEPDTLDGERCF